MKIFFIILALLVSVVLFYLNVTLFSSSYLNSSNNYNSYYLETLENLKVELHLGIANDMQKLFPEGFCFTNILYGLSAAEYINKIENQSQKLFWQNEVNWSIKQLESKLATNQFDKQLSPKYGAFYHSWYTWLIGKYLQSLSHDQIDSLILTKYEKNCEIILKSYLEEENPYPNTYKSVSWPGDVIVGIAALKLAKQITNKNYDSFINEWLKAVKKQLNKKYPNIPHSIQNSKIEYARGSSQSLILGFLKQIDSTFAETQYKKYKSEFADNFIGLSLIREHKIGKESFQDIDSGPVFFGIGSVASIVGISTAKYYDDYELYNDLNIVVEIINPLVKQFIADLVITDLFILWSRISEPIDQNLTKNCSTNFNYIKYIILIISIVYILILLMYYRKRRRELTHK